MQLDYGMCSSHGNTKQGLTNEEISSVFSFFFPWFFIKTPVTFSLLTSCSSFKSWSNRPYKLRFNHCYREANKTTDLLTNLAVHLPIGLHRFMTPLREQIEVLIEIGRG